MTKHSLTMLALILRPLYPETMAEIRPSNQTLDWTPVVASAHVVQQPTPESNQ